MREKCLKGSGTGLAHFRNKSPQSTSRLLSVGIVKRTCYFAVFCFSHTHPSEIWSCGSQAMTLRHVSCFSTYDGEVADGLRRGFGTFQHGPTCISYSGDWVMSKRHGKVCFYLFIFSISFTSNTLTYVHMCVCVLCVYVVRVCVWLQLYVYCVCMHCM